MSPAGGSSPSRWSAGATARCTAAGAASGSEASTQTTCHRILTSAQYQRFPDCGVAGIKLGGVFNGLFRMRGAAPGRYFTSWLAEQLMDSPLARKLRKQTLTFGDIKRADLPPKPAGMNDRQYLRAGYRLTVIASGISSGQMLILPEDLPWFEDAHGKPYEIDAFPIVDAVCMSMSYPFLFTPVELRRNGTPYVVVDGGLLSNFPIWLFDSPNPIRPTWGFRLHPGASLTEGLPYRAIPRPFWEVLLLKAMFSAAMEAWDRQEELPAVGSRSASIPTGAVATTDFDLSADDAEGLSASGRSSAHAFVTSQSQQAYMNSFGHSLPTGGSGVPRQPPARPDPSDRDHA